MNNVKVFRVRNPGLFTTVQDLGRTRTRQFGLAESGAVDKFALRVGNRLVGNPFHAAALELTLVGPELEVLAPCRVSVTGADLGFAINRRSVQPWCSCKVSPGDVLSFHGGSQGCRAYLCVSGGIAVERVFGSRATDTVVAIGGVEGRPLAEGDVLSVSGDPVETMGHLPPGTRARWVSNHNLAAYITDDAVVRVLKGPQSQHFSESAWKTFLSSQYTVGLDSNRVGVRLQGASLEHSNLGADILSEAVPEGAIQVPATGQPIVLLADRRTVGGYAKIATAITVDIPILAQLRPGNRLRFQAVSLEDAQTSLRRQARWWTTILQCW